MVTKLEHEVQLPLSAEHFDQVDQVRVLQVLEHSANGYIDTRSRSAIKRSYMKENEHVKENLSQQ